VHADTSHNDVTALLTRLSADYVWEEDPFELTSNAQRECPWVKTAVPCERFCWCEMDCEDISSDRWFVAWLVSCITRTFPVCR
jgi:hypothetical protein